MRVAFLVPAIFRGKGGAEKVAAQVASLVQTSGGQATVIGEPDRNGKPSYNLAEGVALEAIALGDDAGFRARRGAFDLLVGFATVDIFARIPLVAEILDVPFAIQECTNPVRMISNLHTRRQDGCRSIEQAFWLRQAVFAHASAIRFTVPDYAKSVVPALSPFAYAFYNSFGNMQFSGRDAPGSNKIVCVGAMKNPNKNGLDAVRSFLKFSEIHREWSLHLYGKNSYKRELKQLRERHPKAEIFDHGIVNDISGIYEDASLLVIPSFEEGLPNVVVEAFSYGVPCIGYSDCLGVNHLIEDGVRGRLVSREAPKGIAAALSEFAADRYFLRKCSENCIAFAQRSFQLDSFEKNWLGLMENAASGRNRDAEPGQRVVDRASPEAALFRKLLRSVPSPVETVGVVAA